MTEDKGAHMDSKSTTKPKGPGRMALSVPLAPAAPMDAVNPDEESSESEDDLSPDIPDRWMWKCFTCWREYPVTVTGRCLSCHHLFCNGFSAKVLGRPPCCVSRFDFVGWRRMMKWKRKTFWDDEEREGRRCDVDCHFPGECHGLKVSEAVETAYKNGALKYVDWLPRRTRDPTPEELQTFRANRRPYKFARRISREDSKIRRILSPVAARAFREREINEFYHRQGTARPPKRLEYNTVKRLVRGRTMRQKTETETKSESQTQTKPSAVTEKAPAQTKGKRKRKLDETDKSVVDCLAKGSCGERALRKTKVDEKSVENKACVDT